MSSAYLRLLIFFPAILIPACASSRPAFLMMYSAYKLNKQGDSIQPWRTPFPIWNQSVVPCPVLTVASWSAYRFFKRQVRWSGIPISFRILHSLLWSTSQRVQINTEAQQTQKKNEWTQKEYQHRDRKLSFWLLDLWRSIHNGCKCQIITLYTWNVNYTSKKNKTKKKTSHIKDKNNIHQKLCEP